MRALVCVQEIMAASTDGKWHPSLLSIPWYSRTYTPEYHMAMLHRLQTSSVAVVKDCFHTVDVDLAEDLFACPWLLVSEFFKRRAQVRSCPASPLSRLVFVAVLCSCLPHTLPVALWSTVLPCVCGMLRLCCGHAGLLAVLEHCIVYAYIVLSLFNYYIPTNSRIGYSQCA